MRTLAAGPQAMYLSHGSAYDAAAGSEGRGFCGGSRILSLTASYQQWTTVTFQSRQLFAWPQNDHQPAIIARDFAWDQAWLADGIAAKGVLYRPTPALGLYLLPTDLLWRWLEMISVARLTTTLPVDGLGTRIRTFSVSMDQQRLTAHSWSHPPPPGAPDGGIDQAWQAVWNNMTETFAAHAPLPRTALSSVKQVWPNHD